jgi:hypothetical protein
MSTIQQKLQQKVAENASQAQTSESSPTVYRALRAGRYSLAGKYEFPNGLGQFVAEGSEDRIADLKSYADRGFLEEVKDEPEASEE